MSESKKQSSNLEVKGGFLFCEIAHYSSHSMPKIDYDALGIRPPDDYSDVDLDFKEAAFAVSQLDALLQISEDPSGFPRMLLLFGEDRFIAKGLLNDIKNKLL
jgi:hypothetical protein